MDSLVFVKGNLKKMTKRQENILMASSPLGKKDCKTSTVEYYLCFVLEPLETDTEKWPNGSLLEHNGLKVT